MTTILAVAGVAHIGRRSEHAPGDGMMFRRRLIRSDEAGSERSARHRACRRPPTISGRAASGPIARSTRTACWQRSAPCTRPTTRNTARGRSTNNWLARGEQGRSLHGSSGRWPSTGSRKPNVAASRGVSPTPTPTPGGGVDLVERDFTAQARRLPTGLWGGPLSLLAFVLGVFSPQRPRSAPPRSSVLLV